MITTLDVKIAKVLHTDDMACSMEFLYSIPPERQGIILQELLNLIIICFNENDDKPPNKDKFLDNIKHLFKIGLIKINNKLYNIREIKMTDIVSISRLGKALEDIAEDVPHYPKHTKRTPI